MAKTSEWHPSVDGYDKVDIRAIQSLALYAQEAVRPSEPGQEPPVPSPTDVKRALDWIIEKACDTYGEPFLPGQPDVVNYRLGRRSVGLAIVKLMKLKPALLDEDKR